MCGPGDDRGVPDTDWIEIQAAGDLDSSRGREALDRLLERCRRPMLAHLTSKFRLPAHEAADVFQSFVHEKVIVDNLLSRASPQRGRLRSFLLNALERFAITFLRRQHSRRRHPSGSMVPIEEVTENHLPQHHDVPIHDGELVWAQAVIAGALLDMQAELSRRGRLQVWSVFEQRILLPTLEDLPKPEYSDLVQRFGFKSPTEAFNALVTAKRMFHRHLTSVIAEYTRDNRDVEAELSHLRRILQSTLSHPSDTPSTRKTAKRKPRTTKTATNGIDLDPLHGMLVKGIIPVPPPPHKQDASPELPP